MTGGSIQQQLKQGRAFGVNRIAFMDYGTLGGKLHAIFATSLSPLPRGHLLRLNLLAKAADQEKVLVKAMPGRTLLWLPMEGKNGLSERNNTAWQFMKDYADWAHTYKEPDPKPAPTEDDGVKEDDNVIDLTSRQPKFSH